MKEKIFATQDIMKFRDYLLKEEKSAATIEKYIRDVRSFYFYVGRESVTKEIVIQYKKKLEDEHYAIRSINSMIAALNCFLEFMGWQECKVKNLKQQRETYCREEKELSKEEYKRLLNAAKEKEQIRLVIQTICGTGIRVSELKYFTVEALKQGEVSVRCKNKTRTVLIPRKLIKMLLSYARRKWIHSGSIFVTRNGKPLDRSNIWAQMKALCKEACVNASKVFPHNLRKLFARTFYEIDKDIAKLADILGHGNIETTRIYIMTTGMEHRQKIERLGLII